MTSFSLNLKLYTIAIALLLYGNSINAQAENVAMGQEFAELAAHGGISGKGFAAFQSYSSGQVEGSQFFLPDWSKGKVITVRKETFSEGLKFIYDKMIQELFVRQNDTSPILMVNKDEIQSFSLNKGLDSPYHFVNSKFFTDDKPEVYYQVLELSTSKLTLLKLTKTSFVHADMTDIVKVKQGEIYDAFVDKYFYYLLKVGGKPQLIQLKTKSIKKVFADLSIPCEKYLQEHPGSVDENYLVEMVNTINKL